MNNKFALAALSAALLSGAAFAADVGTAKAPLKAPVAAASSQIAGDVSMGVGMASYSSVESDGTLTTIAGEGRFAYGLGGGLVLQGDVSGQTVVEDGFGVSAFALTGHVYSRSAGGAFGVKAEVENLYPFVGYTAGLEGQLFMGNITLGGELNGSYYTLIEETGIQARGLARIYLNPNTRLQLDASWWGGEAWTNLGSPVSGAASIAQRLAGTPIDLTAQVRYDSLYSGDLTILSGQIGLRFNFDKQNSTILSHDRDGVVFDKYKPGGLVNYYYGGCG